MGIADRIPGWCSTQLDQQTWIDDAIRETSDEQMVKYLKHARSNSEHLVGFLKKVERRARDLKTVRAMPIYKATVNTTITRSILWPLISTEDDGFDCCLDDILALNAEEPTADIVRPGPDIIPTVQGEDIDADEDTIIENTVEDNTIAEVTSNALKDIGMKTPPRNNMSAYCSTAQKDIKKVDELPLSPIAMDTSMTDSELALSPSAQSTSQACAPSGYVTKSNDSTIGPEDDIEALNKTTVKELRKTLSERGLSKTGNKKDLFKRLKESEIATPKSPLRKGVLTPNKTPLHKSASSPALGRSNKRPFNHTPIRNEKKRSKLTKSTLANTRPAGPPRVGSNLRSGSRLRSPSPIRSNTLFKTPSKSSSNLFDMHTTPKVEPKKELLKKKKDDEERMKRLQEEKESLRVQKIKEKEEKRIRVKQKREEAENRRNEELRQKQQKQKATGMSLKERKEMMAKQKRLREKPIVEKSSEEPTSSEPASTEIAMDETKVISTGDTTYVKPTSSLPTPCTPIHSSTSAASETYEMTPHGCDKPRVNKTEDDYGLDDLSSGDETDDDENPRKKVPSWATKEGLRMTMNTQYYRRIDPIAVFTGCYASEDRKVDFKVIFKRQLKDRAGRLEKISHRRETSTWTSPMRNPPTLVDRTLNLDESCFPAEEPRKPK